MAELETAQGGEALGGLREVGSVGRLTLQVRLAVMGLAALACGVLQVWVQEGAGGGLFLVLLLILSGAAIGRWWAVFVAVGPLLALTYLEMVGYVAPDGDYADRPLLSPVAFGDTLLFVSLLLVGVGVGEVGGWLVEGLRRWQGKNR